MSQSMTQLTSQLWIAQSRLYATNSGVFLDREQACLIDPGIFPQEIQPIVHFVAEQRCAPCAIILTHSHWDHILGPEYFPGVRVITQANYAPEAIKYGAAICRQIADLEASCGVERQRPFTIPSPDEVFKETLTLNVGNLVLRLIHAPGHAADQLVIYQPDTATLWAADMLSDLEIPFVSHNLAAYERTLAMLLTLDVLVLIPGHGSPTSDASEIRRRLADDVAYLAELRARATRALDEGQTVEETVGYCQDMRYRCLEENARSHRLNVESVYIELGGQADPARVGWDSD